MKMPDFHPWEVTPREAILIQEDLRKKLVFQSPAKPIRTFAAGDVSYGPGADINFGAFLLFGYPDLVLLEASGASGKISFPYIPGLLTFREAPVLLEAYSRLSRKPDLLLLDGQGAAHPRSMGIASHLGVLLNLPSIGCAKSRLCGEFEEPGSEKGSLAPLRYGEKTIGAALRTRTGTRPVFVSPGHKMDLTTSASVVLSLCRTYRIPEPLRRAHAFVNRAREEFEASSFAKPSP